MSRSSLVAAPNRRSSIREEFNREWLRRTGEAQSVKSSSGWAELARFNQ
jgi:hypothetical protein